MEYNPKGQLQELIQEQDIKDKIKYQPLKKVVLHKIVRD